MNRMWEKESLIPTSVTPRRSQQQSPKMPPRIWCKDLVKHLLAPLVPSPKCHPFKTTELLAPAIAFTGLLLLLYNFKSDNSDLSTAIFALTGYVVLMPVLTWLLCMAGHANLTFLKVFSVVTSSLLGTFLTLLVPILISHKNAFTSHVPFLFAMAIFGGLTTGRMCLVIIVSLVVPVMRLIVGTIVALANLFLVLYLHFAFMHPTFKYGIGAYKSNF